MLPAMAASMSASVGEGFEPRSAAADMIWPGWQKPHWGTSTSTQARCTGWSPRAASPSIVVTRLPAAAEAGVTHERTAAPSRWTVQAPQSAMPHPYLVPVRPSVSRITQSSGVSGGTSTCCFRPLTVNAIMETSWPRSGRAPHDTRSAPLLTGSWVSERETVGVGVTPTLCPSANTLRMSGTYVQPSTKSRHRRREACCEHADRRRDPVRGQRLLPLASPDDQRLTPLFLSGRLTSSLDGDH